MKCSGKWKKKNLVGNKIYNTTPDLEFACGFCGKSIFRKKHQVRSGQKVIYCNKNCQNKKSITAAA